jgi:hypothetical protein
MSSFSDETEILLRQVHPSFIQEGRVSSQAFRPTPKDQKKLSVNRSSLIEAREAFIFYTERKKLASAGVWGVSVREVTEIAGLNIEEDPITDPPEDPSHSLIDFSGIDSENKIKPISSKLAEKARTRGSLFSPADAES